MHIKRKNSSLNVLTLNIQPHFLFPQCNPSLNPNALQSNAHSTISPRLNDKHSFIEQLLHDHHGFSTSESDTIPVEGSIHLGSNQLQYNNLSVKSQVGQGKQKMFMVLYNDKPNPISKVMVVFLERGAVKFIPEEGCR